MRPPGGRSGCHLLGDALEEGAQVVCEVVGLVTGNAVESAGVHNGEVALEETGSVDVIRDAHGITIVGTRKDKTLNRGA